uniref:Uncharacterized protein n=1 Tax=Steinernema glaseri TaxID=37863 RepID=A0A1I7YUT9_9BILA
MSPKTFLLALFCILAFCASIADCRAGGPFLEPFEPTEHYCCGSQMACATYCYKIGCRRGLCLTPDRCDNACKCSICGSV